MYVWYMSECDIRENLDTNDYPNIFESTNLQKQISEYICINLFTQTNARISIRLENCTDIRIYSNILQVFTL